MFLATQLQAWGWCTINGHRSRCLLRGPLRGKPAKQMRRVGANRPRLIRLDCSRAQADTSFHIRVRFPSSPFLYVISSPQLYPQHWFYDTSEAHIPRRTRHHPCISEALHHAHSAHDPSRGDQKLAACTLSPNLVLFALSTSQMVAKRRLTDVLPPDPAKSGDLRVCASAQEEHHCRCRSFLRKHYTSSIRRRREMRGCMR
jgi:hypothetical protein